MDTSMYRFKSTNCAETPLPILLMAVADRIVFGLPALRLFVARLLIVELIAELVVKDFFGIALRCIFYGKFAIPAYFTVHFRRRLCAARLCIICSAPICAHPHATLSLFAELSHFIISVRVQTG